MVRWSKFRDCMLKITYAESRFPGSARSAGSGPSGRVYAAACSSRYCRTSRSVASHAGLRDIRRARSSRSSNTSAIVIGNSASSREATCQLPPATSPMISSCTILISLPIDIYSVLPHDPAGVSQSVIQPIIAQPRHIGVLLSRSCTNRNDHSWHDRSGSGSS